MPASPSERSTEVVSWDRNSKMEKLLVELAQMSSLAWFIKTCWGCFVGLYVFQLWAFLLKTKETNNTNPSSTTPWCQFLSKDFTDSFGVSYLSFMFLVSQALAKQSHEPWTPSSIQSGPQVKPVLTKVPIKTPPFKGQRKKNSYCTHLFRGPFLYTRILITPFIYRGYI